MKKIFVFFLLVSLQCQGMGQTNLDSLWGIWNKVEQADSVRLKSIIGIVSNLRKWNNDSALIALEMQYELAEQLENIPAKTRALRISGNVYEERGNHTKALEYRNKGLAVYEKNNDSLGMAKTLTLIGNLYTDIGKFQTSVDYHIRASKLGNGLWSQASKANSLNGIASAYKHQGIYKKAIKHYTEALHIAEELGEWKRASIYLNNIGIIYKDQGDYDKALEYYGKSLEIAEKEKDYYSVGITLNSIGSVYLNFGNNANEQADSTTAEEKFNLAFEYYRKSCDIKKKYQNNELGLAMSIGNIGSVFLMMGNNDSALVYFQESLKLAERIGYKQGISSSLYKIGKVYFSQGKITESIEMQKSAYQLSKEIGTPIGLRRAAHGLYRCYKKVGRTEDALGMYEVYVSLRDSLKSEGNQREVLRQEYKYSYEKEALTDSLEFAKKEAVMEERSDKQQIGLFAAGGGLFMVLALAFAIYSGKKKSDELLLNILPAETAKELKEKGHADAKLIEDVTVLFTDFKGFTAMAEQLSATELVEDLNICFSEFDRIMVRYGIEKIKTIGDAYMAASGLPTANIDHAHNVIRAAIEMRDFVEAGKAKKVEHGLPFFEIRIGIHTGPVVAGIVGIKKFQYDIWGDTVNTASRMESSGEVGKVNVSETTYNLVKDDFLTMPRGEIAAKGKGKIKMYFVEQA